jgi:hypothetical protein
MPCTLIAHQDHVLRITLATKKVAKQYVEMLPRSEAEKWRSDMSSLRYTLFLS